VFYNIITKNTISAYQNTARNLSKPLEASKAKNHKNTPNCFEHIAV